MELDLKTARRAREFYEEHKNLFPSYPAFRYWLNHRASNGLLAVGAVVESRFGLLIDPARFRDWAASGSDRRDAA